MGIVRANAPQVSQQQLQATVNSTTERELLKLQALYASRPDLIETLAPDSRSRNRRFASGSYGGRPSLDDGFDDDDDDDEHRRKSQSKKSILVVVLCAVIVFGMASVVVMVQTA